MRKARSRRQIGANGRRSSKITRHTLSNKFWPISLKTKARGLRQVSQESSSETGAHVACRAEIPAELTACAEARETFLLDTRTGSRITNHGSPVTNHRFLIDTEAIRNALKSLHLSAESPSNRHRNGGPPMRYFAKRFNEKLRWLGAEIATRAAGRPAALAELTGRAAVIHSAKAGKKGELLKYKLSTILMVCMIFLAAGSARAHHSPSSIFDMSTKFVLTGTLTQVEWVNPHIAVYIDAKKADGAAWRIGNSRARRLPGCGASASTAAISRRPSARASRSKEIAPATARPTDFLQKITFADGNSLAMVNPNDVNTAH